MSDATATDSDSSSAHPQATAQSAVPSRIRPILLQLYRAGILLAICWQVREHHVHLRIEGDAPMELAEAQRFLTNAASLKADHSPLAGLRVFDKDGVEIGYAVRTMPAASHIIGYAGTTDTLVVLGADGGVLGMNIRSSEDTRSHAEDVMLDWSFKKIWNGKVWAEVAEMDVKREGIEGVSGATMTSMAVAHGIVHRFALSQGRMAIQPVRWDMTDIGLAGAVLMGIWLTFSRQAGRGRARRWFQIFVLGYIGLVTGDLIAQSLLAGWARSAIAWRMAPGLALLFFASFLVPWVSRRPLYCQQLCPHGVAQEWILRVVPNRWHIGLPDGVHRGLLRLPALLLGLVVLVILLPVDFDLAGIEPFDAYVIGSAGVATAVVAVVGLIASVFVPKAYCRYGCPTGALLEFVRSHGAQDHIGTRDWMAGLILALVVAIKSNYPLVQYWIYGF